MSRGPGDGLGLGARVSQPLPARCRLRRSDFITWSRRAGRGFGWTALYVCSTGERGQLELNTPAPASGVTGVGQASTASVLVLLSSCGRTKEPKTTTTLAQ